MGQEADEKWTAAVNLQPTLPKSDRLLALTPYAREPNTITRSPGRATGRSMGREPHPPCTASGSKGGSSEIMRTVIGIIN